MENVKITELALSLFDITAKYSYHSEKIRSQMLQTGPIIKQRRYCIIFKWQANTSSIHWMEMLESGQFPPNSSWITYLISIPKINHLFLTSHGSWLLKRSL